MRKEILPVLMVATFVLSVVALIVSVNSTMTGNVGVQMGGNTTIYYDEGKVGIGSFGAENPQYILHVEDASASGTRLYVRNIVPIGFSALNFGNDRAALAGGFFYAGSGVASNWYAGPGSLNLINVQNTPIGIGVGNAVDLKIISGGDVVVRKLVGTGTAYVCADSTGKLFRKSGSCL